MPTLRKAPAQVDLPALEAGILDLWKRLDAFAESNRRRRAQGGAEFVFYDGPPFATGTPHYGHLLAGTIKDIVPRYWSMRGRHVERRFGWDCHGLPIEALAQKALDLHGAGAIRQAGVARFNEQCRSMVLTYVAEWRRTVERMGRWVDFDRDYKTMDRDFMESVWWVFKQLWENKRIYRSHRIMPYSPKLSTPLSKFEVKDDNYREVQDPAVTIRFRVRAQAHAAVPAGPVAEAVASGRASVLAWTTTPWTLPANLALCVGPDIAYVWVRDAAGGVALLAKERLAAVALPAAPAEVLAEVAGRDLVGLAYEPLLPHFRDQPGAFRVLADGFVSTGDGTGVVHMAPAYGEDDFRVCRAAGIDLVDPLDDECRFTAAVPEYAGQFCKDADKAIIRRLKDEGKLLHQATITHPYPFCDRTDAPLIYRAIDAWYVKVEDLRERLVAANARIAWVPAAVGSNRFGNWLKEAKDWNISRNRFWGSCIPVWVNVADPADTICVGSVKELEGLAKQPIADLHKHVLDEVVIVRDGKTYRRTPEVLDCWFESGAMPYASVHWMGGETGQQPPPVFPAQFIAEGLDQTRGWFYTLLVLSVSLFDQPAFANVVVNGLVLAEDGQKMSKSKRNYPDPGVILDQIGADALRAYLVSSPVVRAEPMRFSEQGLREIVRTVVLPAWNALVFLTTYAELERWDPSAPRPAPAQRPEMDRWILSVLQSLVRDANAEMEGYRLYNVVPRLTGFIDDLTNWYIRRSRGRCWRSDDPADQRAAFATLYEVLAAFARVLAPFMPFLTEALHQRLVVAVDPSAPASIHWCDYPQADPALIDAGLEARMAVARRVCALARKLREEVRIKNRQPLAQVRVISRDPAVRAGVAAMQALIADELNVKAVAVDADEAAVCVIGVKPNFAALRARAGAKLKPIGAALAGWGLEQVAALEAGGAIAVEGVELRLADVLLARTPRPGAGALASDGDLTVALDTALTPALVAEGHAREAVSLIQQARKDAGLDVADRIRVAWATSAADLAAALAAHAPLIAGEVLAVAFVQGPAEGPAHDCNGQPLHLAIVRA